MRQLHYGFVITLKAGNFLSDTLKRWRKSPTYIINLLQKLQVLLHLVYIKCSVHYFIYVVFLALDRNLSIMLRMKIVKTKNNDIMIITCIAQLYIIKMIRNHKNKFYSSFYPSEVKNADDENFSLTHFQLQSFFPITK